MADTSKAKTKGVNVALDKTFKKGLLEGLNIGFEGFIGETKEEGAYNVNPPKTKDISLTAGATTKGGTRLTISGSKSKSEGNQYYPSREEKSLIFGISKSFKKGGKAKVKKAYLGSFIAGGPNNQSNQTYRKYYKGMI